MKRSKLDQEILDKYAPGEKVTTELQTPFKTVRGYATESKAIFISTEKGSQNISMLTSTFAALKKWKVQMEYYNNTHLVCLLYK